MNQQIENVEETRTDLQPDEGEGGIEVELADDRPDDDRRSSEAAEVKDEELQEHSEKVQKRIDKLVWQREEEKRQRMAAEQLREEAINFAKAAVTRNREYEALIATGEGRLVTAEKSKAELAVEAARNAFNKAYEEGNAEKIADAQVNLAKATNELTEATRWDADYQARSTQQPQQFQQQQYQQQQPQPQFRTPTAKTNEWVEKNAGWFQHEDHPDMTALAFGIHERLIRKDGMRPDTDEYFETLDKEMREAFPKYFNKGKKKPSTVVASAQRTGGGKSRTVVLTDTALALSKRMGLTPEQYAREQEKLARSQQ
jgi:hypothetical protein